MRILVAGAAGFIGYHLSKRLLGEGHSVVGLDSLTTGQPRNVKSLGENARFLFVRGDISQPIEASGKFDQIYNMACPASPVDFKYKAIEIMTTCSAGVRNLLDRARRDGAVFLQASTSECYGDPQIHPQPETYWGNVNPIGPRAPYDEGKRFAEALTMSYRRLQGVATRIVRIFNTYGPAMRADDGRALPTFIMQALKNEPITVHGDGSQTRSFCYVDDLVEGIVRLASSDYAEPVNIGNDQEVTILQAAKDVVRLIGSRSEVRCVERPADDPERRRPDLARAREVLGWTPRVSRDEGFARTIEYFKSL